MIRTCRRILLRSLIAVGIAVAILAAFVLMVPAGALVTLDFLWGRASGTSGLVLEIESARGGLVRGIALAGVTVTMPDGRVLAGADLVAARLGGLSLRGRRLELEGLRLEGASMLLETGADGSLVGWSGLASGDDEAGRDERGRPWTVAYDLSLLDVSVTVRDTARRLDLQFANVDGSVRGENSDLSARLEGAATYLLPRSGRAIAGEFDAVLSMAARDIDLSPLSVSTNVGDATVSGRVALARPAADSDERSGTSADITLESTIDLTEFLDALAAGAHGVSGRVEVSGNLEGALGAPSYSAELTSADLAYGTMTAESVRASVSGDPSGIEVSTLRAGILGGLIDATAAFDFGTAAAESRLATDVTFDGLDMAGLAGLPHGERTEVAGELSGSLSAILEPARPSDLSASFRCAAPLVAMGKAELGPLEFEGSVADGSVEVAGTCCGTELEGSGALDGDGLRDLTLHAHTTDLHALGLVFGADDLSGQASASVSVAGLASDEPLTIDLTSDDLAYANVQFAPVEVGALRRDDRREVEFSLFGSSVTGSGQIGSDGRYDVSVVATGFDITSVMPDSLVREMEFSGRLSSVFELTGGPSGVYLLSGDVTDLLVSARGETVSLDSRVGVLASPDSVRLSRATLSGAGGSLWLSGTAWTNGRTDVDASFDRLALDAVSRFFRDAPDPPPEGSLTGKLRLTGSRTAPELDAQVRLLDFAAAGISLRSATFWAEADSSDIIFDLVAASTVAGSLAVGGVIPIAPDSTTMVSLDESRELGINLICSGFTMAAGSDVLPAIRGGKRFVLDGSALVTGTPDSLSSMNGGGSFTRLSAEFDLADFSIVDPVYFEIDRGRLVFDELDVDMTRRRVLGEPAGGRVTASGAIDPAGAIDLGISTAALDIGHLARAVGATRSIDVRGRLDAEVAVSGRSKAPRSEFSLRVDSPRVADFGFDSLESAGSFEDGVLSIERAELSAGDGTIDVRGEVATGPHSGAGDLRYDLAIVSDGFPLGRLSELPPQLSRLGGRLHSAMRVTGRADSIGLDGRLEIADGRMEGFDLDEPVRDIDIEIEGQESAAVIRRAHADVGGGGIDVSGVVDFSPGADGPVFFLSTRLRSSEVKMEDLFEGKFSGNLDWGGTTAHSVMRGRLAVERMKVTRSVGLTELIARRPPVIVVRGSDDPRDSVDLDIDIDIEDDVDIESNVARFSLEGGATVGGTLSRPRMSGSFHAEGGTFTYQSNEFSIDRLGVGFIDQRRTDPHIDLLGTAEVESRAGDTYQVTARMEGFLREAVPILTSTPELSEPDIVALLTFGTTFGGLVSGDTPEGSSGDSFGTLATGAFLSRAFGLAENSMERLLHLDKIAFEEEALATGNIAEAGVTLGKEFGGRLEVNYTTSVGRFSNQRVEVSFELARRLWLESRTDPEGNHAVGLKLEIPFR